jgi:hypothetical protein
MVDMKSPYNPHLLNGITHAFMSHPPRCVPRTRRVLWVLPLGAWRRATLPSFNIVA